ncbi:DUF4935 domain-containing protein [Pseudomonas sp. PDM18]|uniref:PIN-like domain-containing protein n=1 Tax=Pseudomonas sp. PDM18 TaxID=2769253 RepID=UPI00177E5BA7|nr:PIN-like domain-containing protein [Pseudomonas sp. PDM18]MBD9677409.1 DUF4935 domain-containing protein [Pseudomonas sp. PDM18]
MSGTDSEGCMTAALLDRLESILNRGVVINSLGSLTTSVLARQKDPQDLRSTAIAIDSSAFLRISRIPKSADVIDYLASQHEAPIILPGQVIQEFWNNQLNAVDTQAATLKKRHEELKQVTQKIDNSFEEFHSKMEELIAEFESNHGYIYDESIRHITIQALKTLESKAKVPYVPRQRFHDMAIARKRTKTPPGFKDDGDGDFYIWLDLLFGLMQSKQEGASFSHVLFVTNDVKLDWSRNGMPHPILAAEMEAAIDCTLDVVKIDQFGKLIVEKITS